MDMYVVQHYANNAHDERLELNVKAILPICLHFSPNYVLKTVIDFSVHFHVQRMGFLCKVASVSRYFLLERVNDWWRLSQKSQKRYIRRSRNALILDNRRSGAVALPCIFMNVIRLTIIEWGSQREGGLLQFFLTCPKFLNDTHQNVAPRLQSSMNEWLWLTLIRCPM